MKVAAMPISAIDRTRPMISTVGWSCAAPGHGQHVVERHRHVGDDDLGRGLARRSCAAPRRQPCRRRSGRRRPAPPGGLLRPHGWSRSSRHIFQQTHSSRMPPAISRPAIASKLRRDQRKADAQHGGGDDADQDRLVALILGQAGRGKADDDGIVAGSTRSIMMTCSSAAKPAAVKISIRPCPLRCVLPA